jgi:acetylornithine deacetylase
MSPPAYSAKEMLAKLVGFDTTSEETNLPLIAFVKHYLAQYGIESHLVPSDDGHKAGLFATIGPKDASGVGLSGHTDVVPITDQCWNTDPFTLVEKDGRLYGRGAADMKSYLACVLAAVPEFQRRRLTVPIHIILSYDEEVGCIGVRPMIAEFGTRVPRPRMVIVGEPTSMTVVDAHKGPVRWRVDVTGRAAHSSVAPLGVNAITYAGRLLAELDRMEQELKASPRDERFTPAYTTLQVTRIAAGTANNIVPNVCWFGWEVRALPGLDTVALERRLLAFAAKHCVPEMNSVAAEADIIVQRTNEVPAFAADSESEIVALTLKLSQAKATHAVSFATEAGLFQAAGAAAVVCGPGDISQAHTANEWIAAAELEKCSGFLMRLADWAAG